MNKQLIHITDGDKYTAWRIPEYIMMFYNSGIGCIKIFKIASLKDKKDIVKKKIQLSRVMYSGISSIDKDEYFQHGDLIYTLKSNDKLIANLEER